MQGFALNNISDCYVGSNQASEIWLGQTKIWPTTPPHDYSHDYLTFEALETTTFSFTQNDLQYSLDNGATWTTLTAGNSTPQLSIGDKILWKQTGLIPVTTTPAGIGTFSSTGNYKAYGNIMSLYYDDNFIGEDDLTGKDYAFCDLFYDNYKLINTENLILPATTLSEFCYEGMFAYCSSLTTTPKLLTTTLDYGCYADMFVHCTSLTTAPELPATTLIGNCYGGMFLGCTSLTTAPELPATTLVPYCYVGMFNGCTSLNYIKCLATNISTYLWIEDWVQNVAASGTFVKDANTTWSTGASGIPSGWTIQNA